MSKKNRGPFGLTHHEPMMENHEDDMTVEERAAAMLRDAGYIVEKPIKPETPEEAAARIAADAQRVAEARLLDPRFWWPKDKPLPQKYVKGGRGIDSATPCPRCRRVRDDNGAQAVRVSHSGSAGDVAYFRCSLCSNTFSLPVEKAPEPTLRPHTVGVSDEELAERRAEMKADREAEAARKKERDEARVRALRANLPEVDVKQGALALASLKAADQIELGIGMPPRPLIPERLHR